VDAGSRVPLELADCPDRRLAHAVARLVGTLAAVPGMHVTVVLPRRSYPPLAGRLLHDHTADHIARVVSRIPGAAATIVPFDVRHRVKTARAGAPSPGPVLVPTGRPGHLDDYEWPTPPPGTDPIGSLRLPGHATVQGRLHAAEIKSGQAAGNTVLTVEVGDSTGELSAVFYGRAQIMGVEPGTRIRLHGTVGIGADGHPAMINPAYELLK
jgi:hypothetical protein